MTLIKLMKINLQEFLDLLHGDKNFIKILLKVHLLEMIERKLQA